MTRSTNTPQLLDKDVASDSVLPSGASQGAVSCRACGGYALESVLDLGRQPLANRLLTHPCEEPLEYPLHLRICTDCFLGQVEDVVVPDDIFRDYPYLSSVSSSWVEHSIRFAREQTFHLSNHHGAYVLEIASNDGYLLEQFQKLGVSVLGVEPAVNVATLSRRKGIQTITEFFGERLAKEILIEHGYPGLIAANNVFAHVPDITDFARGLATLCGPATRISIENPSFLTMLLETQFDTIYHEHFSYLSAHSVRTLARNVGLELFDIEFLTTHGGSNRYWLCLRGTQLVRRSVDQALVNEENQGLKKSDLWGAFRARSELRIRTLQGWLDSHTHARLAAYGAAAKGNTLLNATGSASRQFQVVFDGSPEKVGKFLPGSAIPIVDRSAFQPGLYDDILILPWNIAQEVSAALRAVDPTIRLWRAIPQLEQVT